MIICFGVVPFVFTSPRNLPGVSAYFRNLGRELAGGARKELQEGSIARRNQQHPMKLKKLYFDGQRDALPCRLRGCERHDARSEQPSGVMQRNNNGTQAWMEVGPLAVGIKRKTSRSSEVTPE